MRRRAETFSDFYQLRRLPLDAIRAGDEKKNIQDAQEAVPAEGHRETKPNRKPFTKQEGVNMAAEQAKALTNLFNALDNVPADRKEKVIAAAAEYLQEIRMLQAAGASRGEIEAAGERIRAKYS